MFLRIILQKLLKLASRAVLQKQKPQIVVVTGSLGKTSTKEAVWQVLKSKFKVRKSKGNYNNEIGVPLTILNVSSPRKSILKWIIIFLRSLQAVFFKLENYPEILVLEMASQKPGDLRYLMGILPKSLLKVVVLTAIAPCHLEFFGSINAILKEKITPFFYLQKGSLAIVNKDSCNLEEIRREMKEKTPSHLLTYGFSESADIKMQIISIEKEGINFNLVYKHQSLQDELKDAISPLQLYPLAASFAVGVYFKVKAEDILLSLKNYCILKGRLKKIQGKKGTLIIDDTYNSSPEATKTALKALSNIHFGKRKIAILGDMLELGKGSQEFHREIGRFISKLNIDFILAFGKEAKYISEEAVKNGVSQNKVFWFRQFPDIIKFINNLIDTGDILLVKGSRGMKMEKIVQEIMLKPTESKELLVDNDDHNQQKN